MARQRSYTDEQLAEAIDVSTSWRGVLRSLGLSATSSGAMRSVRAHAERLGLEFVHLTRRTPVTEERLRAAIATASSWEDVGVTLGIEGAHATAMLKSRAAGFGVDAPHFEAAERAARGQPDLSHLDRAGSLLAAGWFTLYGGRVSWPLEPCRYDLLADLGDGLRRVQVKTTTVRVGETWKVYLSSARGQRRVYTPDEIDDFFIIDGALNYYVIPLSAVGGLRAIHLRAYAGYRVRQPAADAAQRSQLPARYPA